MTCTRPSTTRVAASGADHLRKVGFDVRTHNVLSLLAARNHFGVPDSMASCHSAKVAGYVIEGHVPVADILLLIQENRLHGVWPFPACPSALPEWKGPKRRSSPSDQARWRHRSVCQALNISSIFRRFLMKIFNTLSRRRGRGWEPYLCRRQAIMPATRWSRRRETRQTHKWSTVWSRRSTRKPASLTLSHGPLESLNMPAMTMVFRVKEASWLDQMKVGDKIRFMAESINGTEPL